jgi:hypothetical protein
MPRMTRSGLELNNITGGQLEFTNTPAVKIFRNVIAKRTGS